MGWCSPELFYSPVRYALCRTPAQLERELKSMGVKREDWPSFIKNEWSDATTHFFDTRGGESAAVVTVGRTKGKTAAQVYALLTHEAVHIWQEIRERIGEKSPSHEFEAYAIQRIAQNLICEYQRLK